VVHLERYARGFGAPILDQIDVTALASDPSGGFVVGTSEGPMRTDAVVVATGAFQRAHRPSVALPTEVLVIDAASYTRPDALPAGGVLVVGSGQTGCQIADELHRSGRTSPSRAGRPGGLHAVSKDATLSRGSSRRPSSSRRSTIFRAPSPVLLRTSRPPAATAGGTSTTGPFSRTA